MDVIDQIFKQLKLGKSKVSSEIVALLSTIDTNNQPKLHAIAMQIVENWPETQQSVSWMDRLPARSTLMGGGLGIAGIVSLPWMQQILAWFERDYTLPTVQSPLLLLVIVGGLGAIAGAGYSIYCQRGIVRPEFGQRQGVLTLTRYGILNEIAFGALAAVTTIWLVTVGLVPPPAGSTPAASNESTTAATTPAPAPNAPWREPLMVLPYAPLVTSPDSAFDGWSISPSVLPNAPAATPPAAAPAATPNAPSLLSYSVILGSLVSGWMGARMRSFRLGQSLLTDALSKTAVLEPKSPEVAAQIRVASPAAAAQLATGMDVIGARLGPATTVPAS
jgi:hypothetical protein